jgi:hypothetical protein
MTPERRAYAGKRIACLRVKIERGETLLARGTVIEPHLVRSLRKQVGSSKAALNRWLKEIANDGTTLPDHAAEGHQR